MFIAYRNAASRKKITPYFTASKNILLDNADEERIINCMIEAADKPDPHDLAAMFFIENMTNTRKENINRILKARIPVTIFTPTPMRTAISISHPLLDLNIITEATFAQFKDGPIALFSINTDIQLIYPEDNMFSQLDAMNRNIIMIELIEPLCHSSGVDFPLDDPLFRILRYSDDFTNTCQWQKILYLGDLAIKFNPTYNSMLHICMSEASIRLGKHKEGLRYALIAQQMSNHFEQEEMECQAQYFALLSTWVITKPFAFFDAKHIMNLYEKYELDNELLYARILALMLLSCFNHPTEMHTLTDSELMRFKELACKTLAEHHKTEEYTELSAAYESYVKHVKPTTKQLIL